MSRLRPAVFFLPLWSLVCCLTASADDGAAAGEQQAMHHGAHEDHSMHMQAMAAGKTSIEQHTYDIPDLVLTTNSGDAVNLRDVLSDDQALAVNFIYTTCTTICPVMTATFVQLQQQLRNETMQPRLVSISIDPTYDTPEVLDEYAGRFNAEWAFLTGTSKDIDLTLRSFDASRGSKVNHFALTLMRAPGDDEWTRVEGLTSASRLVEIWREVSH